MTYDPRLNHGTEFQRFLALHPEVEEFIDVWCLDNVPTHPEPERPGMLKRFLNWLCAPARDETPEQREERDDLWAW